MNIDYKGFNDELYDIIEFKRTKTIFDYVINDLVNLIEKYKFEIICKEELKLYESMASSEDGMKNYMIIDSYFKFSDYINRVIKKFDSCKDNIEVKRFSRIISKINKIFSKTYVDQNFDKENFSSEDFEELIEIKKDLISENIIKLLFSKGLLDEISLLDINEDLYDECLLKNIKVIDDDCICGLSLKTLYELKAYIEEYDEKIELQFNYLKETDDNSGNILFLLEAFVNNENIKMDDGDKVLAIFNEVREKNEKLSFDEYYYYINKLISMFQIDNDLILQVDDQNTNALIIACKQILTEFNTLKVKKDNVIKFNDLLDSINKELQKRENNFVKSIISLSKNYTKEQKIECLRNFFRLGLENTTESELKKIKFENTNIEDLIQNVIDKIINNETLVNQVVAGEHLFNNIDKYNVNLNEELQGDYTFLVTSQIKAIERFLKESILKNLKGKKIQLSLSNDSKKYVEVPCPAMLLDDLDENDKKLKKFYTLQLGQLNYTISEWLKNPKVAYRSKIIEQYILKNKENSVFYMDSDSIFYTKFISKVRNGHFHTSIIKSISDARKCRIESSFWLLCVIYELKGL